MEEKFSKKSRNNLLSVMKDDISWRGRFDFKIGVWKRIAREEKKGDAKMIFYGPLEKRNKIKPLRAPTSFWLKSSKIESPSRHYRQMAFAMEEKKKATKSP